MGTYTLVVGDADKILEFQSRSPMKVIVPPSVPRSESDPSETFPPRTLIRIVQAGTGPVTVCGAPGVFLWPPSPNPTTRAKGSRIDIRRDKAANTWTVHGDYR